MTLSPGRLVPGDTRESSETGKLRHGRGSSWEATSECNNYRQRLQLVSEEAHGMPD